MAWGNQGNASSILARAAGRARRQWIDTGGAIRLARPQQDWVPSHPAQRLMQCGVRGGRGGGQGPQRRRVPIPSPAASSRRGGDKAMSSRRPRPGYFLPGRLYRRTTRPPAGAVGSTPMEKAPIAAGGAPTAAPKVGGVGEAPPKADGDGEADPKTGGAAPNAAGPPNEKEGVEPVGAPKVGAGAGAANADAQDGEAAAPKMGGAAAAGAPKPMLG
mmetsp:Transcript_37704/g.121185  ORF Transcript_37704/g.121185 Transcript_37704/m.121185 type:complete len:216 (-) Transcript_37704:950-1597(-)|eukprot:scaffold18099_cov112-Isochrysis_galbana.AAC.10